MKATTTVANSLLSSMGKMTTERRQIQGKAGFADYDHIEAAIPAG
jgi:hypothetical protein